MTYEKERKYGAGIAMLLLVVVCLFSPISVMAESGPKSETKEEQRIVGKWLRPDGGYVLELSEVKAGGTLRAAYFNPRPIHVAKSEWRRMAGRIQVFVELQDINYPGSTYTLVFDPEQDQFNGYYYQAAINQTFDVVFVRKQ
ncbi:MAG: hypothetical protein OEV08_02860 [Nitrospira sp.]|nr:hypothetical protein [Nitrospira sp.]